VGDQLARVLAKNPFSYARANDVALAAEQPNASAYNAILTLP
jgi:hypothetical protein